VLADNSRAIAFYEKNGFVKEGLRKEALFQADCYLDEVYMAKSICKQRG
jgi:RimJ/RimL family protein N-acetyltransferase